MGFWNTEDWFFASVFLLAVVGIGAVLLLYSIPMSQHTVRCQASGYLEARWTPGTEPYCLQAVRSER